MLTPPLKLGGLQLKSAVLSTRVTFLIVGIAMASWAPLVPLAKARLGLDDGALGGLLLFLGIGSIVAMPITGVLTTRIGCRAVIVTSGMVVALVMPFLAVLDTWLGMAVALAIFGAAVGTMDVAMNVQAVIVERQASKSLMSGFHGLFSLGGIFGAGGLSLLLGMGVLPLHAVIGISSVTLVLLLSVAPALLPIGDDSGQKTPLIVIPRGRIIFLGILSLIVFLAEGAVLDWSAVYLIANSGAGIATAGLGYAFFAVAMTVGRLSGDRIRARFGETKVLMLGGILAAAGFLIPMLSSSAFVGLLGFLLVGAGAANAVPVLFSAAGRSRSMPSGLAIASVTTLGYSGVLAGPALIGFVSQLTSLNTAFALVAASLVFVGLSARGVTRGT